MPSTYGTTTCAGVVWRVFIALFRCAFPWLDSVTEIQSRIRLRAQPLESSLGRVPQAADGSCKKNRKPDRVGRRGLSEPREDFSRLTTYAWTQKWFVQFFGSGLIRPRAQTCCAELRRLARLANSPGFKSFRCPR